ncbi:amidohydrolase family protein [bacterium]|nr:amidohydrolase family protein [bacterium]
METLCFEPRVPIFDANVGVGHRPDQASPCDSPDELLAEMAHRGVERAVIYHLQAEFRSPVEGNEALNDWATGKEAFSLQWSLGATDDSLRQLRQLHADGRVSSVRLHATIHARLPFVDWLYGPALEWLAAERIPLWISLADTEVTELMAILPLYPQLVTVLLGAHYVHAALVRPMLRRLPNAHLELSRYEVLGEVEALIREFGIDRFLYGSFYPRYAMGPILYYLHHLDCTDAELAGLCAGNLERLLNRQ